MIPQYSRVQLTTARFEGEGVRLGMIGYVIECYADGNYEIEFSNEKGITIAQVVASGDDIRIISDSQ